MISLEVIALVLTGLSITASILYYTNTLKASNKARQAQVYTQIWSQFSSPEWFERYFDCLNREWNSFDDYFEKYGKQRYTDTGKYAKTVSVGAYYEGIGVLLKNGFIDIEPVVDLLGTTILMFWEKVGPIMQYIRVRQNDPRQYQYAEYLYNQTKPVIQKEHPTIDWDKTTF